MRMEIELTRGQVVNVPAELQTAGRSGRWVVAEPVAPGTVSVKCADELAPGGIALEAVRVVDLVRLNPGLLEGAYVYAPGEPGTGAHWVVEGVDGEDVVLRSDGRTMTCSVDDLVATNASTIATSARVTTES